MIDLYTAATPNGYKISIALEELGLPYTVHVLDFSRNEQKSPEYLKINPNGRVPAIVDRGNNDLTIFESGAILLYLADKAGKLMPKDEKGHYEAMQWLMFQMSGVGPMQGQANVFYRYFPEKIQPAIDRYQKETLRLYGVLEGQLEGRDYICGDFTIVDIATWVWVRSYAWAGLEIDEFPNLAAWIDRLATRPSFVKGVTIPPRAEEGETLKTGAGMIVK